jgi:hypothetical protein
VASSASALTDTHLFPVPILLLWYVPRLALAHVQVEIASGVGIGSLALNVQSAELVKL